MPKIELFGFPFSANTHRVKLFLSLLGRSWTDRLVDLRSGEQRSAEFSAINSFQQVPVLKAGNDTIVESHAILIFLAEGLSPNELEQWWPLDPADRAEVARWLFLSAGDLHFGVGLARNERSFHIPSGGEQASARACCALERIDAHLETRSWLALDRPTLADVSVYPFLAVLDEAGLELSLPNVDRWRAQVEGLPGFLAMPLLRDFLPPRNAA